MAEAALRQEESELAYAAAGHGLARGEPYSARFLFLRARSLPGWPYRQDPRVDACLSAAAELARDHRDMELVAEIVEAGPFAAGLEYDPIASLGRDMIASIIQREIEQTEYLPWREVAARYKVGTEVRGPVVSKTDYGCFIELEEGVEGLVHSAGKVASQEHKDRLKKVEIGEELSAVVLDTDSETKRISLGLK